MEKFDYQELLAQRKAKAESQAREYFYNQKKRKPFYCAEGSAWSDLDSHNEAFFHFTDDEVARIKQLVIDTVNVDQPDATPVNSVDEALKCLTYNELFEMNDELRHLLGDRCEKADLDPNSIDFDKQYYFYRFRCLAYDYDNNKVCEPIPVDVLLSDEDYLALLSLQVGERDNFCFNRLLQINPDLAIRVNNAVQGCVYGWQFRTHVPFAILFDEVRQDAEIIDGPLGASDELYNENTDDHMYHVIAAAQSRILTITEEDWNADANFAEQRILDDINADEVMNALDAKDYRDMIKKLKQHYSCRSGFDDLKMWLSDKNISFSEKTSE